MIASTDDDLLHQLLSAASTFATAAITAAAAKAGVDQLSGTFSVLIDLNPFRLVLLLDGQLLASRDGDAAPGAVVAPIVERGLSKLTPPARQRAAGLLQGGHADMLLRLPLGTGTVHGILVARADVSSQAELFTLMAGGPAVVH